MERRKFLQRVLGVSLAIPVIPLLAKEKEKEILVLDDNPDFDLYDRKNKDLVWLDKLEKGEGIWEEMKERNIMFYTDKTGMEQFHKALLALQK